MKTYKIGGLGQSIKDYCENIRSECALIERNIEKLESKRATLYEMSLRLQNDFIEEAYQVGWQNGSAHTRNLVVGSQLSTDSSNAVNAGSCLLPELEMQDNIKASGV
jgi:hypothetical protein